MTQPTDRQSLDDLLGIPLSEPAGRELLLWVRALRGRIQRGELATGILSLQDARRAPLALRRAVACGLGEAWLELASWLTTPPIGEPNYLEAEQALRSAIAVDVPGARRQLVELRWFYQRAETSASQRAEAINLLRELLEADAQDSHALYLLGLLTCQGFGTAADPKAAFQLQRSAAARGHLNAQFELYVHYARGLGVPQDDHAAFDAAKLAANAGHPRALFCMGAFHATGQHVPKSLELAAEWYEKAFDAGNVRAAVVLAVMYATGDGVERDVEYAEQLFRQAKWLGYDVSEAREAAGLAQE